jgi:HlyD family secretion protein
VRTLRLNGVLEPALRQSVSAPISARVLTRRAGPGDTVKAGDVLMELQDDTLDSRIRSGEIATLRARARLQELQNWATGPEMQEARRSLTLAELSVNEQRKVLEEAQALFAKDIVPEQEVNSARSSLQRAELAAQTAKQSLDQTAARASETALREARLEADTADTDLRQLQQDASRRLVTAPTAGLLLAPQVADGQVRLPNAGDQVNAGQPLFVVGNTAAFTVSLKVDELEIRRIEKGLRADVIFEALPDVMLTGEVIAIAGQASLEGQTPYFEVRVGLAEVPEDVRGALRLGMSATVEITTAQRRNVLAVPLQAVQDPEGEPFVWVEEKGAKDVQPAKRPVTIGLTDNNSVEITSGLEAGTIVRY